MFLFMQKSLAPKFKVDCYPANGADISGKKEME
jgi:hypothetical protein